MDIEVLTKFGMTNVEAKVYLEIAKLDETPIGPVIKKTGLHRGTVYNCINSLIKKGFVGFVNKNGMNYYKSSGSKMFENLIKDKKSELEENKNKIDRLLEDINRLQKSAENQEVQVFYGVSAFKNLFLEIYDECREKNIEYLFLGEGGKMTDAVGQPYYKYTQELKKKMRLGCRIILSRETKALPYRKYTVGNIKYLPTKISSPVNFWIYHNKVLLVIWDSNPLISIRITSNALADGFRNYFEYLWNVSK
jgi:predicted transcriptional regulator